MATRTSNSARNGVASSKLAKSSAPGARSQSSPARRGTSDTTTLTEPSPEVQNTSTATGQRRRTKPQDHDGDRVSGDSVVAALKQDLKRIAKLSPELASSALAKTAIALAKEMDNPASSATSKSMCAKALFEVLDQIRTLTPAKEESDGLDDLARRRAARLARSTAAAN